MKKEITKDGKEAIVLNASFIKEALKAQLMLEECVNMLRMYEMNNSRNTGINVESFNKVLDFFYGLEQLMDV